MFERNEKGQFIGGKKRGAQSQSVKDKISKANSGDKNGMYHGGKPNCKTCGVQIWYGSTHCNKHTDKSYLNTPELNKQRVDRLLNLIKNEETHPRWKGENAGYVSKHKWVVKHYGKPEFCEACGTEEKRRYEWANISGEYIRKIDDWMRMCVPCHRKFDDNARKLWITRRLKTKN